MARSCPGETGIPSRGATKIPSSSILRWRLRPAPGRLTNLAGTLLAVVVLLMWGMPSTCVAEQTAADNVLVVFSNNRLLPANIEFDRGLSEVTEQSTHRPVRFFAEFLDSPEFGGETYEIRTTAYLQEKYAARPPQVIVAGGREALRFLLRHRAEGFPGVPIVHGGVDRSFAKASALPADVIGVPTEYDIRGTLELALRLQPTARRLVVVTGASSWCRDRLKETRAAIEKLSPALPVEYLAALPASELAARLSML